MGEIAFFLFIGFLIFGFTGIIFSGIETFFENNSFIVVLIISVLIIIASVLIYHLEKKVMVSIMFAITTIPASIFIYCLLVDAINGLGELGGAILLILGWLIIPIELIVYAIIFAIIFGIAIGLPFLYSNIKDNQIVLKILLVILSAVVAIGFIHLSKYTCDSWQYIVNSFNQLLS